MTLNRGFTYREQARAGSNGVLVTEYLAQAHGHSTIQTWTARVSSGEVDVDDVPATLDTRVRQGNVIAWRRPPWDEPDVPLTFDLIFEDEWLVAVSKPSGVPTMPAGGFVDHTLLTIVRERWPRASPLHRLGRWTSGLVLFARTGEAASVVARAWRERRVDKRYLALGRGEPAWDDRAIDTPIGPVPHERLGTVHAASPSGRPSRSLARVVERRGDTTLFEVDIVTGRPHQVRIHLASAGHPLAGDPLYGEGGVPVALEPGLPGDGGYLLHASRLAFDHPISGTPTVLESAPPATELRSGEALES
jgi:23S rRNA pseudouridine1911/1915/1917 synthase